jgi:hypothetical protein
MPCNENVAQLAQTFTPTLSTRRVLAQLRNRAFRLYVEIS